jgi:uncharacterized protein DUF6319
MLSEQDIDHLRNELAAKRPAMVWFTAKAVGVQAGKSAKVMAFDEPAEGDYIQVKPTGSQDVLSFSAAELTTTRPPRKRAAKPEPEPEPVQPKPSGPILPVRQVKPPAPRPGPSAPAAAASAPAKPAHAKTAGRAKPQRQAKPAEVAVSLNSTPEGEWTVEVVVGKKRSVRPMPVAAAAVARAAKELPAEVAEAIGAVLDAARRQHEDRVAQLRAELEAAQRALDELS